MSLKIVVRFLQYLNSKWHGIPLQLTNVVCMWPMTATLISPLRARKYHAIRESKQMADHLIAQHYFHGVLVHRVVKLSFSNMFFPDRLPYIYPHTADAKSEHFHVVWLPSYRFASFSCALFSFKFHCFHFKCGLYQWRQLLSVRGNWEID